ncbi:penicillin-binding protein activator [Elioraea rosea]|uniref:penicillin-binding protein activator n=1 Tax=Elioraea rosea TaxID=2492390 RepID=UPI001183880A|nr:penicillin-binding protein activator [Elioraea rosea]
MAAPQMMQRPALGPDGMVRAGLLLPLSGPQAAVGRAMLDAATLAVFQNNAPLVLLPKDTGGTPAGAAAAAQAALAEGASIILGPLFSGETEAVGPIARAAGVNVLAFTTDAAVARDNVFVLGQLPGPAVRRVVAAARAGGAERFAAIVPDTAYGRVVLEAFRRAVADAGGQVVKAEIYSGNPNPAVQQLADYARRRGPIDAQIRAARAQGTAEGRRRAAELAREARVPPPDFDALILADGGERLRAVASLLPYYDVDNPPVKFLGTPLMAAMSDAGREPALVGTIYAAPDESRRAAFDARYSEAFGPVPPIVAGVAYDAAAIAAVLAAGGDLSSAALTDPNGFAGVLGIIRLLPDGTNQRGLSLMEVTRGGANVVEPAPDRFDAASF